MFKALAPWLVFAAALEYCSSLDRLAGQRAGVSSPSLPGQVLSPWAMGRLFLSQGFLLLCYFLLACTMCSTFKG